MVYEVFVTLSARSDAQQHAAFIRDERHSPGAARKWLDGLYDKFEQLGELPQRFGPIPEAAELEVELRSFVYHSHRVIFAIDEDKKLVIVHRVYHGARKSLTASDIA